MPDPAPAELPATLTAELDTIAAAIAPAIHAAAANGQVQRLARVAAIAVYEYAPSAPVEMLREGAIRLAGWLLGAAPHLRDKSVTYPDGTARAITVNVGMTASALRHSGASALLAPYRAVRAFEGF